MLYDPDGRLESPWECSIRKTRNGYIVTWYIEIQDSKEPLYRLEEYPCKSIKEAIGIATEYLGEHNVLVDIVNEDE